MKQIAFFVLFDELKMHQLRKFVTNRISKHMVSISCKDDPKVAPKFATEVGKKRKFVLTDFASQVE